MKHASESKPARVLIVGRSPRVLLEAVETLRQKGYAADATNQFDQVFDDYDATNIDVLVLGGMVPVETKQHLRETISVRNPGAVVLQGLAGIAGVIVAQVEEALGPIESDDAHISYDTSRRSVKLTLRDSCAVSVTAWWATSFAPPEPTSASMTVFNRGLPPGAHSISVPDNVPSEASFLSVAVGPWVRTFTLGAVPDAVRRLAPTSAGDQRLPPVSQVTTRGGGE